MPYEDERAGLAAIRTIAKSGIVDDFSDELINRCGEPLPLPPFTPCSEGTRRNLILAIDGSNIYKPIPGALPCTEAGLVSLGVVIINLEQLDAIQSLPESGAMNPRSLKATEEGETMAAILPGRNAAKQDGTDPKTWFRETINNELLHASLGGENFAETLYALLAKEERTFRCPNELCGETQSQLPKPGQDQNCPSCGNRIWLADALRIHENFIEYQPVGDCHSRFRDLLEILALMNSLRYLAATEAGMSILGKIAFVMDGPLAAFGTIAILAKAIREELRRIQELLHETDQGSKLLVMSGIKTGPFVEHAAEIDRAPQPDQRIPENHVWLPDNQYIRTHIIAGALEQSKPWGELTYFGRPVILKTPRGQRLVLNIAQPDSKPPLTEAPSPDVLGDAITTASPLGVGAHQFLPLRRVHAQASIPLRAGTDLIGTLAP